MKIVSGKVIGFGKWADVTFDFSNRSLVCFYGENESGKSTIRKFILFMLFGMPPKQRDFYRPKTSGKMGGRLTILDEEIGFFTIERMDHVQNGTAICYLENGITKTEDWFKERLGGMSRKNYEAIFSFSATELNDLENIDEASLGEILLSISISGSQRIYQLEKQLEKHLSELFKPFGKKPMINKQLEKLEQLNQSLKKQQGEEALYREKINASYRIKEKIWEGKVKLEEKKQRIHDIEKVKQLLPAMEDYRSAMTVLKEEEWPAAFPEHGIERLEQIHSFLLPLKSEETVLRDNGESIKEKIQALISKKLKQDTFEQARILNEQMPQYKHYLQKHKELEGKIQELQVQLDVELDRLNIPLEREQLSNVSIPFHLERKWNELKQEYDALQMEKQQLEQEEKQWKQERHFLMKKMEELEKEMLSEEEFRSLKEKYEEQKEQEYVNKLRSEWLQKQTGWKKSTKKREKRANTFLLISITISVLLSMAGLFQDNSLFFVFAAFLFLSGFFPWLYQKQSTKEMEKIFQKGPSPQHETLTTDKERLAEEIHVQEKLWKQWQKRKEQLMENEVVDLRLQDRRKSVSRKQESLSVQLKEQYTFYPFLQGVEVRYWPELYHDLKRLALMGKEIETLKQQQGKMNQFLYSFQTELQQFFQSEEEMEKLAERLEQILSEQQQYEREILQLEELLQDYQEKERKLQKKMEIYEKERLELLHSAGADTEDEFYRNREQLKEKQRLQQQIRQMRRQLNTMFPEEKWKSLIERNITETALEYERENLSVSMKQLEKELEQLQEQYAMVQAEIQTMESSEAYSNNLHQFEMEKEQLRQLAKEWSVYKAAKEILRETKGHYQKKYLSKVMERTSEIFRSLTNGKYKKVFAPMEGIPFQVEDGEGVRFIIQELSQGTIHQLYVSLRLAISEMIGEEYPFPFIIDDAFLHFDSIRLERVLEQIQQLSKKQQVLFFTCKEEIVESFNKNDTINLENQFA